MRERHTAKRTTNRNRKNARDEANFVKDDIRDEIVDWLRDAYAMERALESALEKQARSDDLARDVRKRASEHLKETRRHAELVRSALRSMDTDTSGLKTGIGIVAQASKGLGTLFASDQRIKDLLDAYSMEHFEIACYTALSAAAEKAGLSRVVDTCERILPDEERMARALLGALPREVKSYLFETETERS